MVLFSTSLSGIVSHHHPLQLSLLAYAQYFLVGLILAEFYLSRSNRRPNYWPWDCVSLAGWPLLLALLVRGGDFVPWVAPWLILLLYIAAFQGPITNRVLSNPWITTIGGMCYSIYLLHGYTINTLSTVTHGVSPNSLFPVRLLIQFLLITPVALVIAGLYFRFVERPCMNPDWPRQLSAAIQQAHLHRTIVRAE
jgi:peptidoglycan/LPS O-acetylase OafA/YrhL